MPCCLACFAPARPSHDRCSLRLPHAQYIPNISSANPGKKIDFVSHREAVQQYRDQLLPYQGAFGCNPLGLPHTSTTAARAGAAGMQQGCGREAAGGSRGSVGLEQDAAGLKQEVWQEVARSLRKHCLRCAASVVAYMPVHHHSTFCCAIISCARPTLPHPNRCRRGGPGAGGRSVAWHSVPLSAEDCRSGAQQQHLQAGKCTWHTI